MKNEYFIRILFIGFIIAILSCQNIAERKKAKRAVAKIDHFEITYQHFADQFKKLHPGQPLSQAGDSLKKSILDDMINQQIALQEAYRLGYDKDDEVIEIVKKKERELAAAALEKAECSDKVFTKDVIRQFYRWSDRWLNVRLMVFKCGIDDKQKEEKEKKAQDIYRTLQQGADFKNLAARYSEHASAAKDSGNIGHVDCYNVDEEIFKHAYDLSEGEIGKPFYFKNAYYILKVEKVTPQPLDSFENERPRIESKLREYHGAKLVQQLEMFKKNLMDEFHYALLPENIRFFCERAGTMKTRQDSTHLFDEKEKTLALWETDFGEFTIAEFFRLAFEYYWSSLNQQELVELLLSDIAYDRLKKHKAMIEGYNRLPDVVDALDHWTIGFLKSWVIRKEVMDKIDASDTVLKPIYERRKNGFVFKERRTVREIFRKTEDGIQQVYQLAIRGHDFEALEKKYQQNQESRTHGLLGPFTKGPHGKLGENAFTMKIGEICKPFRYRGGYSIIKLLSIDPQRIKTFEEAKEELKNAYIDENADRFISQWLDRAKENYKIKIL